MKEYRIDAFSTDHGVFYFDTREDAERFGKAVCENWTVFLLKKNCIEKYDVVKQIKNAE